MRSGDVRGFFHVCCMGTYREVTREIVHALLESRLYDRSTVIEVGVLGSAEDQQVVEELLRPFDRFHIAYRSTDLTEYEFPTLGLLQDACQTWDGPVYYLHTKGVSASPYNQFSRYWRRLMLDEVVANHEQCIAALGTFDAAGTNWSATGFYSGNFWWARPSHIRALPDIRELQRNPRTLARDIKVDGTPVSRRGVGPIWNQRLHCEYWLSMVPGRLAKMGHSRPNLYRQLLWTTAFTDLVNELLEVSPTGTLAELSADGTVGHAREVRAQRSVSVALNSAEDFFASPDSYDVVLIEFRDNPAQLLDLIERCLPKLNTGGALVVPYSNPPTAWHQRADQVGPGAEWTGQVWRAVVKFRIRHPQCEVFTVDTHWGCTVIRPDRPARHRPDIGAANRLGWKALAEQRTQLLNLVDVAWFRRNLHAAPFLNGLETPSTAAELANILIAAEGLDSFLQIGPASGSPAEVIAPIRHSVHSGEDATYRVSSEDFFTEGLGLERYDLILLDGPGLEHAINRVSDCGWIITREPPPRNLSDADVDWWTCGLGRDYTLIHRHRHGHSDTPAQHPHAADSLLRLFRHRDSAAQQDSATGRPDLTAADGSDARLAVQPYEDDIGELLAAIELDPDDLMSVLLLGDAYYNLGDFSAARKWYTQAAELREWWWTGFDTGVYLGLLSVAQGMESTSEPWPDVRDAYLKAWEVRPDRLEPLHAIALRYRLENRFQLGYLYAKPAADMPCPDPDNGRLPGEAEIWRARDELALCALRLRKVPEAFTLWRELLPRTDIPDEDRRRMAELRDECVPKMLDAASGYPEEVVASLVSTTRAPGVVVTMIAGPGCEAVEQTLNSFLNCCHDIIRVGRFLAVDAGLSPEDRATLQQRYGFLEFITGPAQLANIRSHVEARLWLHLGRGWRFYAPDALITRLEAVLDAEPEAFRVALNFAEKGSGYSPSEDEVRRAPGAGRYLLEDHFGGPAGRPAMYDTARLDRVGGFGHVDRPDGDALPELGRRADAAGLRTATLDEQFAVGQTMVTVIGRGNSGTRIISHTLIRSGVFMGEPIKKDSVDLVPAEDLYEACRIISRHIPWLGGLEWDFGPVQTMPIPREFTQLVDRYLSSVLASPASRVGWKLPETTLCYPWLKRLYPDIRYIFWVRNPRDAIVNPHLTDDLSEFGIQYPETDDPYLQRAISWKYQDDLVAASGRPEHHITVRLEDFITHQDRELARLEEYLGFPLARVPLRTDPIDRHKRTPEVPFPDFLAPAMRHHRYEI